MLKELNNSKHAIVQITSMMALSVQTKAPQLALTQAFERVSRTNYLYIRIDVRSDPRTTPRTGIAQV